MNIKGYIKRWVLMMALALWGGIQTYSQERIMAESVDIGIEDKCRSLLKKGMSHVDGADGQIAVVDTKTGQPKAWVALEKKGNIFTESKLHKNVFSSRLIALAVLTPLLADINASLEDSVNVSGGMYKSANGLIIRDFDWRVGGGGIMSFREALVRKSNVVMYKILLADMGEERASAVWTALTDNANTTNAMDMAALFSNVYNGNKIILPSLKGGLIRVRTDSQINPLGCQYLREILTGLNKADGIQAHYAPKEVEIAGIYGNYRGKELDNGKTDLAETSFVGVLPAKDALYSVCVFIHRPDNPVHSSADLARNLVNELAVWLSKR